MPKGKFFDERLGDLTRATGYVTIGSTAIASSVSTLAPTRLKPVVVSVGRDDSGTTDTSDDVIRRVRATLEPVSPFQALEAAGNLKFDTGGLVTTTVLNGSAQANGNVTFSGGLLSTFVNTSLSVAPLNVSGSIAYDGASVVTGLLNVNLTTMNPTSEPPVSRKPVTIAASKPDCPTTGCPSQYTASNHSLVASSGTVTLAGGDYVFCKVSITGTSTTVRPVPSNGKPVRIFVDDPKSARCIGNAADPANGNIKVTGRFDPGVNVQPSQVQFYTVDPTTSVTPANPATTAEFDTTTSALSLLPGFFFYGPTSNVTLKYSTFQGNIIANNITLTASGVTNLGLLGGLVGNGTFTQDLNVNSMPLTSQLGVFSVAEYGECSAEDVASPAASTDDC